MNPVRFYYRFLSDIRISQGRKEDEKEEGKKEAEEEVKYKRILYELSRRR